MSKEPESRFEIRIRIEILGLILDPHMMNLDP
jgi:hypothetical protein